METSETSDHNSEPFWVLSDTDQSNTSGSPDIIISFLEPESSSPGIEWHDSDSESIIQTSTPLRKKRKTVQVEDPLRAEQITYCAPGPVERVCCKEYCLKKISLSDQKSFNSMFASKNRSEQQQFLLDSTFICRPADITAAATTNSAQLLMLQGIPVCKTAFFLILGVTTKRFRKVTQLRSNGIHLTKRKPHVRSQVVKSTEAKAWMKT